MAKTPNLELDLDAIIGAGPQSRAAVKAAFVKIDGALAVIVPAFDPEDDEGKVLKVVSGELAWAADATGA
jgi:hypothetical protein